MQIDIPEKEPGDPIVQWLKKHELLYHYCGSTSYGSGQGHVYHFMVNDATAEDAIAFKLYFPNCEVHHSAVK